eukprot:6213534-Pleurochrysis_carterae.AAC.2
MTAYATLCVMMQAARGKGVTTRSAAFYTSLRGAHAKVAHECVAARETLPSVATTPPPYLLVLPLHHPSTSRHVPLSPTRHLPADRSALQLKNFGHCWHLFEFAFQIGTRIFAL